MAKATKGLTQEQIDKYIAQGAKARDITEKEFTKQIIATGVSRRMTLDRFQPEAKPAKKAAKKAAAKPAAKKAAKKVAKKAPKKAAAKKAPTAVSEGEQS